MKLTSLRPRRALQAGAALAAPMVIFGMATPAHASDGAWITIGDTHSIPMCAGSLVLRPTWGTNTDPAFFHQNWIHTDFFPREGIGQCFYGGEVMARGKFKRADGSTYFVTEVARATINFNPSRPWEIHDYTLGVTAESGGGGWLVESCSSFHGWNVPWPPNGVFMNWGNAPHGELRPC